MYASDQYGSTQYGGIIGGSLVPPDPNVDIDLSDLGVGGRLNLQLSLVDGEVNATLVDLDDLGDGGRLEFFLNRSSDFPDGFFADAGELWKRVPQHSSATFQP